MQQEEDKLEKINDVPRKDITARVDIITKGMEIRTMVLGLMKKVF